MYKTEIFLNDLAQVKKFVDMTTKYSDLKINLVSDIYTIDAHSLIGTVSLGITHPITLELPDQEPSAEFLEDLKPYLYSKGEN